MGRGHGLQTDPGSDYSLVLLLNSFMIIMIYSAYDSSEDLLFVI